MTSESFHSMKRPRSDDGENTHTTVTTSIINALNWLESKRFPLSLVSAPICLVQSDADVEALAKGIQQMLRIQSTKTSPGLTLVLSFASSEAAQELLKLQQRPLLGELLCLVGEQVQNLSVLFGSSTAEHLNKEMSCYICYTGDTTNMTSITGPNMVSSTDSNEEEDTGIFPIAEEREVESVSDLLAQCSLPHLFTNTQLHHVVATRVHHQRHPQQLNEPSHSSSDDDRYLVLYFGADWCRPCQRIAPLIPNLQHELLTKGDVCVAKIDADLAQPLFNCYHVQRQPHFIILNCTSCCTSDNALDNSERALPILDQIQSSSESAIRIFIEKHISTLQFDTEEDF